MSEVYNFEYYSDVLSELEKAFKLRHGAYFTRAPRTMHVRPDVFSFRKVGSTNGDYKFSIKLLEILREDLKKLIPEIDNVEMSNNQKRFIAFRIVRFFSKFLLFKIAKGAQLSVVFILRKIMKVYSKVFVEFRCIYERSLKLFEEMGNKILQSQVEEIITKIDRIDSKNDSFTIAEELSNMISSDVMFHSLLHYLDIHEIIRLTRVSRSFNNNIWNFTLKNREKEECRDFFFLFEANQVSDSTLSKLIDFGVLDATYIMNETFPFLFECEYINTMKSLSRLGKEHQVFRLKLIIDTNLYCQNMRSWKENKISLGDIVSKRKVFHKLVCERWIHSCNSSWKILVGSPTEMNAMLILCSSFDNSEFRERVIVRMIRCFFEYGEVGVELDFVESLTRLFDILLSNFENSNFHRLLYLFLRACWNGEEAFQVLELVIKKHMSLIDQEKIVDLCHHIVCGRWPPSGSGKLFGFLVQIMNVDVSSRDFLLLRKSCYNHSLEILGFLLDHESVQKNFDNYGLLISLILRGMNKRHEHQGGYKAIQVIVEKVGIVQKFINWKQVGHTEKTLSALSKEFKSFRLYLQITQQPNLPFEEICKETLEIRDPLPFKTLVKKFTLTLEESVDLQNFVLDEFTNGILSCSEGVYNRTTTRGKSENHIKTILSSPTIFSMPRNRKLLKVVLTFSMLVQRNSDYLKIFLERKDIDFETDEGLCEIVYETYISSMKILKDHLEKKNSQIFQCRSDYFLNDILDHTKDQNIPPHLFIPLLDILFEIEGSVNTSKSFSKFFNRKDIPLDDFDFCERIKKKVIDDMESRTPGSVGVRLSPKYIFSSLIDAGFVFEQDFYLKMLMVCLRDKTWPRVDDFSRLMRSLDHSTVSIEFISRLFTTLVSDGLILHAGSLCDHHREKIREDVRNWEYLVKHIPKHLMVNKRNHLKSLLKFGICSHKVTGNEMVLQYFWKCKRCNVVICQNCAVKCHGDHGVVNNIGMRYGICVCFEKGKSCKCVSGVF